MEEQEAKGEVERAEARVEESTARVAALEQSISELQLKQRALTRGQLVMDAQRVWGSVSGTAASAEPTVFDLTGLSAEGMTAAMAELTSAVNQEVTGAEERAVLERSRPVEPVEGVRVEAPVDPGVVTGMLI